MSANEHRPLSGISIVETGDRIAVGACGSVLAALGADVTLIQHESTPDKNKWIDRAIATTGKRVVQGGAAGQNVESLLADADIVLASSDLAAVPNYRRSERQIFCDITAYGKSGPLAGKPHPDPLIQALTGLADTTGEPGSPPSLMPFPVCEGIAALYAAAGVLAALRVRLRDGFGQDVDVALYDCAFSTLSTFLPFHIIGKPVTRAGNRHVLAAPWNVYRARDGWVCLCTGTDDQWRRLCGLIGRPELATDSDFVTNIARVAHCDQVDAAVHHWISQQGAAECGKQLKDLEISSGPIVTVEGLRDEPNMAHRAMITGSGDAAVLGTIIRANTAREEPAQNVRPLSAARKGGDAAAKSGARQLPFAGLRVLEIGQFTTAPLVARQLGALGAEVLKIESPGGDAARGWPPNQDGQGYFFTFSNSDKQSLALDLKRDADRAIFKSLVAEADVLVENLKPGALTKLELGPAELAAINPRLVYCGISGFGADSAYPGRPAFDTVVQAMCGIMDLIRLNDVPQKAGISLADILGGVFSLTAVSAALLARESTQKGEFIDISMQDAGAWITQWCWRNEFPAGRVATLACSDGYVVAANSSAADAAALDEVQAQGASRSRAELAASLTQRGLLAVPVLNVTEAAGAEQTTSRSLMIFGNDSKGRRWPLLNCPIRLSATPAVVQRPIGPLGEANEEVMQHLQSSAQFAVSS